MTEIKWLRNYIEITDNPSEEIIRDAVESLQKLLANNSAFSKRIIFLDQIDSLDKSPAIENPISPDQMHQLVRKGLIKSYEDGDILAENLFKMAHSVEGLEMFTSIFGQVPRSERASCWSEIAYTPSFAPEVELEKLLAPAKSIPLWNYVLKLTQDWIAVMSSQRPSYAIEHAGQIKVRIETNQESSLMIMNLLSRNKVDRGLSIENQRKLMDSISTGAR